MMRNVLTRTGLILALAITVGTSAAVAKPKAKPSAEHIAAVKKCKADYAAAIKAAASLKGKAKADARAKAKADETQCIANAPK
jgi:hypothetical protein